MMSGLTAWLRTVNDTYNADLLEDVMTGGVPQLIDLNSTSIILHRNGTAQAAQTVRVEALSRPMAVSDVNDNARVYEVSMFVLGYKNHPTITDTNILSGDEFGIDGYSYRVLDVIDYAGGIQARCYRT